MSKLPVRIAFPAAVLLLAAGGCTSAATRPAATPPSAPSTSSPSSPANTASPGTSSAASQLVISNFAFSPAELTVHPGQSITVVNHDAVAHTVTAVPGGSFDTGPIKPGGSATFTAPASAGSYPYVCTIHASMHGTLIVK